MSTPLRADTKQAKHRASEGTSAARTPPSLNPQPNGKKESNAPQRRHTPRYLHAPAPTPPRASSPSSMRQAQAPFPVPD